MSVSGPPSGPHHCNTAENNENKWISFIVVLIKIAMRLNCSSHTAAITSDCAYVGRQWRCCRLPNSPRTMTAVECQTRSLFLPYSSGCVCMCMRLCVFCLFVRAVVVVGRWTCVRRQRRRLAVLLLLLLLLLHTYETTCVLQSSCTIRVNIRSFVYFQHTTFRSCCYNPHTSEITCKVSLIRPKSHPTEWEKKAVLKRAKNRIILCSQSARKLCLYILEIIFHARFER